MHSGDVVIDDRSDEYGLLALQGPIAQEVLQKLTSEPLDEIKFFRFKEDVDIAGHQVLISRTGYTGEDGFEIYGSPESIVDLWSTILEAGEEEGVVPADLVLVIHSVLKLAYHSTVRNCQKIFHHLKQA